MRPRIVAGNWKMNSTLESGKTLAKAIIDGTQAESGVQVVVCPPFPYLTGLADLLRGSKVALGAQNCHFYEKGAFTGEVAAGMLVEVGCQYVILGHSERRHGMNERDSDINRKVHAALAAKLQVILCVGETLEERDLGWAERTFYRQVASSMAGLKPDDLSHLVVAYEPVWAIGTGRTATPEVAQKAHLHIREHVRTSFGKSVGDSLPILYGGSVTADNATELFSQPDVDGGLIGGASLKPESFLAIVRAAVRK